MERNEKRGCKASMRVTRGQGAQVHAARFLGFSVSCLVRLDLGILCPTCTCVHSIQTTMASSSRLPCSLTSRPTTSTFDVLKRICAPSEVLSPSGLHRSKGSANNRAGRHHVPILNSGPNDDLPTTRLVNFSVYVSR